MRDQYRALMDEVKMDERMEQQLMDVLRESIKHQETADEQSNPWQSQPQYSHRPHQRAKYLRPLTAVAACFVISILGYTAFVGVSNRTGGGQPGTDPSGYQAEFTGQEVETLAQWKTMLPFAPSIPNRMPDGYEMKKMMIYNQALGEIEYANSTDSIYYRIAKGDGDISGVYEEYEHTREIKLAGQTVTCRLKGERIYLATWTDGELAFSLDFQKGVSEAELLAIVESIE